MFSNHKQKQRKLDTPQISAGILQKLTAGSKAKSATENKIARTRTVWGDKTSNQAENNESSNPIKVGDIVSQVHDKCLSSPGSQELGFEEIKRPDGEHLLQTMINLDSVLQQKV